MAVGDFVGSADGVIDGRSVGAGDEDEDAVYVGRGLMLGTAVGASDGATDGRSEGDCIGLEDGVEVGPTESDRDGVTDIRRADGDVEGTLGTTTNDGIKEGEGVGFIVGATVGRLVVGKLTGAKVGKGVGDMEGLWVVGLLVGFGNGTGVGSRVGSGGVIGLDLAWREAQTLCWTPNDCNP